ncbi:cbb3-type cytochrome c oxidase subunit II [Trinickia caryophylli]|uniref:Cytochrome c oxidase cbb3-type subunit 2 n=1 Tax=Trinickia caryophylli TaxID=28094 RepID=A0A1X7GKK8_TRICW|nr:cbb3-type cytochrome c oxidase subunit II [Trinickia caryophylli]PMS09919.1 cytochrome-c oxidase [Trinickia caryophylli]TRX14956.1 cytochrome-c oxidase [Trinickia caryophylli]WQE14812.1 cbb3-type cytochrome c oxidase subunit II [Trinickia caryophylli]SMF70732.1 cytochrome c oxidase cbb3-type subunit 2 [Trinickia caryophylli]GLU35013.1 cytochrome-c oxidase [Trinickia caryophylli]
MNRILTIAVGSLIMLAMATLVLVALPYRQLRDEAPPEALKPYTVAQLRGRATYVNMGCVYCHSQQPRAASLGPDALRGWGRPSVPADYAYDYPHLLGVARTGPDLFNIGARQPSAAWQLAHLYQPRAVSPSSVMPAYPFLFEVIDRARPGDTVVQLPPSYAPANGKQVVASQDALDLVTYLSALNHTYPAPADSSGAMK